MVDLGLEFPCSENRGEEGDKLLYRLAHDEARAARSAFRPGRLWGAGGFGEAKPLACLRGGTRIKNIVPQALKIITIGEMELAAIGHERAFMRLILAKLSVGKIHLCRHFLP